MDPTRAIDALQALKAEVADPSRLYFEGEAAQSSWKSRVIAVFTHALGSEGELTRKMRGNTYGLMAFSSSTPDSAWANAHRDGVDRAKGYIDAAIFELQIRAETAARKELQPTAAKAAGMAAQSVANVNNRAVMVVHGRNRAARDSMFAFLRSLGLTPIEWDQARAATGRPNPYIGDILKAAFDLARAVLVFLTPDDEARLRSELHSPGDGPHEVSLTPQARANVIFEAGMAMAWDENRTVLVELGHSRPFSDVAGRHTLRLDNSSQKRQELAMRLRDAGLSVDVSGIDWHTAGDFNI